MNPAVARLQTRRHNQLNKETRRLIFIDEGQDAVRSRVQAVKAIVQSEVSAIVTYYYVRFYVKKLVY
jgi:hypothetical protein